LSRNLSGKLDSAPGLRYHRAVFKSVFPARVLTPAGQSAIAAAGLLFLASGLRAASTDWPEFRGPTGDGHAGAAGLPLHWSETNNVRWKSEIPLFGWSTPVVMGGQVWMTSATADGHDFYAICVDADTGKIIYDEKVFHSDNPEPLGNGAAMNCYAAPSPAIEPGRVYVHFGSFGTACLDTATGKVIWKRDDLRCRHYRGPSSSVILYQNLLILTFDGADLQYHAALDKLTGQTIWKTDRSVAWNDENSTDSMTREGDRRKAHSTPLIVTAAGKPQMLSVGAKAAYSYDPSTGKELWKVQFDDWSAAPRPIFEKDLAFIVTGLNKTELWAIKPGGLGDVTSNNVVWKFKSHVGKYASPIVVDGLIYTAADQSLVTCVEAATGQSVWTARIGGNYEASPIYADGRLYFFNQQGVTTVLEPGRTCGILATNSLSETFMASPAVSGKSLFLRAKSHLYRVEDMASDVR
jgi:outer membrane protein assembly factor BamB